MSGFTKLFSSIVTSSLWCHDHVVLRVWIAMLATCDSNGIVEGSVPGFAHLSMISIPEMQHALEVLMAPDPHSRTKEHDGRRIEPVDGGWLILNYAAYRKNRQGKSGSRAPYMHDRREKEKGNMLHLGVTRNTEAEAEAEAEDSSLRSESTPTPSGKGKLKRLTKAERLAPFRPDVVEMLRRLEERWPRERKNGSKVANDLVDAASNVEALLRQESRLTVGLLERVANEWLDMTDNPYPNAIQFFFGPGKPGQDPPWLKGARAVLTREAS